ncbi:MAG: hypothetical protein GX620_09225 [Chloroflexi bacterium]|nr:hypothetical protein [Chloroflexota bacterium]
MTKLTDARRQTEPVASLSHVADARRRYPGESVVYWSRVEVHRSVSDPLLRIALPPMAQVADYHGPRGRDDLFPSIEVERGIQCLQWRLTGRLAAGSTYEFSVEATLPRVPRDVVVESDATLYSAKGSALASETASVAMAARGRYLRYLPELYEEDELMGQFLMLFESFWGPIESQIGNIHCYFDPKTAPASMLPWLASWVDAALDERVSDETRRQLIQWAVPLYRRRGTSAGLQRFLEIYTGGDVEIVEYRAENLCLGATARLGPGIALGQRNMPHTFTVRIRLPEAANGSSTRELDAMARRVRAVIDAEKPAHTTYDLHMELGARTD